MSSSNPDHPGSASQTPGTTSTFKALSISYADRIRPKTTHLSVSNTSTSSSANASGSSSPVTVTAASLKAEGPSSGPASGSEVGPSRHHNYTGAERSQGVIQESSSPTGRSQEKRNGSVVAKMSEQSEDEQGWQSVTVRMRPSRSQLQTEHDKKNKEGSRLTKKGESATARTAKDKGRSWSDAPTGEPGSAALKADNWRSSSQSRHGPTTESPQSGGDPNGSTSLMECLEPQRLSARNSTGNDTPINTCDSAVPSMPSNAVQPQQGNEIGGGPSSQEPLGEGRDSTKGGESSNGMDGSWRKSAAVVGKPAQPSVRTPAPVPSVNVWQVRREQMAVTAPSASSFSPSSRMHTKPEFESTGPSATSLAQAANTASGPTPRDASDYLAKGSGQKKGSSQALGTSSSASKDFGSSPARRTKAATPTVTDTDAWPDVRMAAVGRAAKVIKDEEESVTSNAVSTQPSGKKDKIKWIPISPAELQLTPDKPERHRRAGGNLPDPSGKIKRAANGPPDRGLEQAVGKSAAKGGAARKGAAKATPANGTGSYKKTKPANRPSASESIDASVKSSQSAGDKLSHGDRCTTSSAQPSESNEATLTVEVGDDATKRQIDLTSTVANAGGAATAREGVTHQRSLSVDDGRPTVSIAAPETATRNGAGGAVAAPSRGAFSQPRGGRGMRGGRGWRGGGFNGNYIPANRTRASVSPPTQPMSLKSVSLPVSNNVSPRLMPTYSNYYADPAMTNAAFSGYAYPVGYYGYVAPAGYAAYSQDPAMSEQLPAASFAAFGPPPPMPVTVVPGLDPLRIRILGQLEYYFGDQNLPMDFFLRQQMDAQGWIDIAMVASFNRVKSLSTDLDLIREVLQMSSVVEVREQKVRLAGGKHKSWILPDAAPSIFGDEEATMDVPIIGSSGIISNDLPAEARDRIAGDVTRDVLRAGSSAAFDSNAADVPEHKGDEESTDN